MKELDNATTLRSLAGVPVTRIFIAAFLTQFCMGLESLFRISAGTQIKSQFFDLVNPLTSGVQIGQVLGALFLGFAIANFLMAPLVDVIGMRRVHVLSIIAYLVGTAIICLARPGTQIAFYLLWGGSLIQGLAWGSIESALNPLVVSIYPTKKVAKLNLFHAAFALGMLIAAPTCVLVEKLGLDWRVQIALVIVPAGVALFLVSRVTYPPSERVVHGVSFSEMFSYTLKRPLFYLCLMAMFLTSAAEIVPANWMDLTLTKVIGIQGIWLVALVYSVHVIVRTAAGWLDARLGSAGILTLASGVALAGLLVLSQAHDAQEGVIGAVLFGMGTAFFWPTSLAATSERFPAGGAFAIGTVASAGMLASYVMMPVFGSIFDSAKISAAGGAAAFKALDVKSAAFTQTIVDASGAIYQVASIMPLVTFAVFGVLWFRDSRKRRLQRSSVESPAALLNENTGV
jgi:MFS family permease